MRASIRESEPAPFRAITSVCHRKIRLQHKRSMDTNASQSSFCMTHDNTRAVLSKFLQVGATKVHSAAQLVYTLDHDVQNTSPANLKKYAEIEAFAAEQGVSF